MIRYKLILTACIVILLVFMVSCLRDLPEEFPSSYEWDAELALPLGVDSFGMNIESGFDTTLLNLDSLTGVPEWVNELEFVMYGSLPFDLASLNESEEISHLMFRINLYNGFPNQAGVQGYFQGPGSITIDSMFGEGPITVPAARVLGNGEETDPGYAREDARFSHEEISALSLATSILITASFRNLELDSTLIPYYPAYDIIADIGVMIGLNMEF